MNDSVIIAPEPSRFCRSEKADGKPCGAYHMKDSEYCSFHDPRPEVRARREAGRKMGGARSPYNEPTPPPPDDLAGVERMVVSLENLVARLEKLRQTPANINSLLKAQKQLVDIRKARDEMADRDHQVLTIRYEHDWRPRSEGVETDFEGEWKPSDQFAPEGLSEEELEKRDIPADGLGNGKPYSKSVPVSEAVSQDFDQIEVKRAGLFTGQDASDYIDPDDKKPKNIYPGKCGICGADLLPYREGYGPESEYRLGYCSLDNFGVE